MLTFSPLTICFCRGVVLAIWICTFPPPPPPSSSLCLSQFSPPFLFCFKYILCPEISALMIWTGISLSIDLFLSLSLIFLPIDLFQSELWTKSLDHRIEKADNFRRWPTKASLRRKGNSKCKTPDFCSMYRFKPLIWQMGFING